MATLDKAAAFRLSNFTLRFVDIHKIDGKHYKDSEYVNLMKYILDMEQPKNLSIDTMLELSRDSKHTLAKVKRSLDAYL